MKILVAIASYGTSNDGYLQQVLAEYRSMPFEIDFIVLSNLNKKPGPDVEVKVGLPTKNPWSLPFGHKQVFADRLSNYDLFIYTEDDILCSETNIRAFLAATEILREDEIAGFLRTEIGKDGKQYFCDAFDFWHWDPWSVRTRGNDTFAYFTNEHAGFYILTQEQLRRAIDSGGFLTGPRTGRYKMPETAATDPYTQCGFRKVICISRLDDFLVAHLSNKYVETVSLEGSEFRRQVATLMTMKLAEGPRTQLLQTETRLPPPRWSKSYYEPCRTDVMELIPPGSKTVLSVGCGWGAQELKLQQQGITVTAVPLDPVIASLAEARGIRVIAGDQETSLRQLQGEKFDCLLFSNVLHLVPDPVATLSSFTPLLTPQGYVVARIPNLSRLSVMWRRLRESRRYGDLGSYEKTGFHLTNRKVVKNWLQRCRCSLERIIYTIPASAKRADQLLLGLASSHVASELIFRGKKN